LPLLLGDRLFAQEFAGRDKLRAHTAEFRKDVIKVTDGIYVAVGFSLGNSILIEGNDGLIVVDTLSGVDAAREVKAEFDKISKKPVRAIIYTHFHGDHTGGARVFAGDDRPEIYAHRLLVEREPDLGRAGRDGGNQFGGALPEQLIINAGVGPQFPRPAGEQRLTPGENRGYLAPTKTLSEDRTSLEIAGVKMDLVLAPGETEDQIYVWLPEKRALLPGDNFYRAFPNIYAIRGTRLRRPEHYIASLEKMLGEGAQYLVPSHSRPIVGAEPTRAALTAYRDGIRSVFEQTVAGMKEGLRPDELVQRVKLPVELAASPYLQEFYGAVEWSVRAIYTYHLGWFDGNATNLFPLSYKERGAKVLELAGGEANILSRARAALAKKEFQWVAELADYVLASNPDHREARQLKAQAFTELAERQINATARNFYLSSAQFLMQEDRRRQR
jgi:alkyl sulfatase BDS1-like metallo-beta-lactamase superfamily hydrolase